LFYGYVALTNDRFKKLFDILMSVVADFKEFKADLDNKNMSVGSRKNTASLKSVVSSTGSGDRRLHCGQ